MLKHILMKACVVWLSLMPPGSVLCFTVHCCFPHSGHIKILLYLGEPTGVRTVHRRCLACEVTCQVLG